MGATSASTNAATAVLLRLITSSEPAPRASARMLTSKECTVCAPAGERSRSPPPLVYFVQKEREGDAAASAT
jgi:hypothetical protein